MIRCNRDNKGRFARHQWDMSFMQAISSDAEFRTCIRCGAQPLITKLVRYMAKKQDQIDTFLDGICNVMGEKNEILTDMPWKEAV